MIKRTIAIIVVLLAAGAAAWFFSAGPREPQGSADALAVLDEDEVTPAPDPLENVANGLVAYGRLAGDPILVVEAKLAQSGYVVVHRDNNGAPGAVIGVSELLPAGMSRDVLITLARATAAGETYWAMLHADDGDGIFEFPGSDAPVADEGAPVMVSIPIL